MRIPEFLLRALIFIGLLLGVTLLTFHNQRESLNGLWIKYELAPAPTQFVKEFAGYLIVSIPKVVRILTTGTSKVNLPEMASKLEGFHTSTQFTPVGVEILKSSHFAENFYFWANVPKSTDFVLTTRLSFSGVNGSHVIPWFTVYLEGEEWNLPEDFEASCLPHRFNVDLRVCDARKSKVGGKLLFENLVPLKRWRLSYAGPLVSAKTKETRSVDASFDVHFQDTDLFVYQLHMCEVTAARSMALKPWDPAFFRNLRNQNQERYASRSVKASGYLAFVGGKRHEFPVLDSSRDHNWGVRNWNFLRRYVWWPAVKFAEPLVVNGVAYRYFTGSFVDYGNVFQDLIAGGLISDEGKVLSFASASRVETFAKEWFEKYREEDARNDRANVGARKHRGIGHLVPKEVRFALGLVGGGEPSSSLEVGAGAGPYVLRVEMSRGAKAGYWEHSFWLKGGEFEIHEAMAKFSFALLDETTPGGAGGENLVGKAEAVGLFEFGANLVPYGDEL